VSQTPIPADLRRRVEADARRRCGYCLCLVELVGMEMLVDHIRPESHGGKTVRSNLWLACNKCSEFKSDHTHAEDPETGRKVRLFNPRRPDWSKHFRWVDGGLKIEGLTPTGRATVVRLKLNRAVRVIARGNWLRTGKHPPRD